MVLSMTGFGRAEAAVGSFQLVVDIRSLNGKQSDVNMRIPSALRPIEPDVRNAVNAALGRGSVDVTLSWKQDGSAKPMSINTRLAKSYFSAIKELSADLDLSQENILSVLLQLPEVVSAEQDMLSDDERKQIRSAVDKALSDLVAHRKTEGAVLAEDMLSCVNGIEQSLPQILPLEPKRMERLRAKLETALAEWVGGANVDKNRLEQELIYYIEKIDFSEEKIRLVQHCQYFKEILHNDEEVKGKKLGFILQEVGREINTLGSKANDADIQKIIVGMKDLLEKAKEQVLNVL